MPHGELTAHVARALARELSDRDVDVLFDHGEQSVDPSECLGQIASWFGTDYRANAQLAFLDIAVVQRDGDKVMALIEIEESTSTPKVLLGDLFATLLGDHVAFQGKRRLKVGEETRLIVLVQASGEQKRQQIATLADRVHNVPPALRSGNSAIGHLLIETFVDETKLERKVKRLIREVLDRYDE